VRFQEQEQGRLLAFSKHESEKKNNHPFYLQKTNKLSLAADGSQ